MRLEVVGCRSGLPTVEEPCSSYLVRSGGTRILLDAGAGAFSRLPSAPDLDAVYITHAHPDHLLDAALIGYERYLRQADPIPLCTTGRAWELLTGVQPLCREAFEFVPMRDGERRTLGALELTLLRVPHGAEEAYAVRVDDGEAALLYTGDCGPDTSLRQAARGIRLLLIEAGWGLGPSSGPQHLTVSEACRLARDAGAPRTVLTHVDPAVSAADALTAAAAAGVAAEVARPGARFDI